MSVSRNRVGSVGRCARAAVTGTLCGLLVGQPLLLAEAPLAKKKPAPAAKIVQVQGEDRVLHALNRLTFGPRPGDVAAVQQMGLATWFERQLNPSGIDDSVLEARLAEYPAMNMSLADLESKYPAPQTIRAMAEGKQPLPQDPTERAMVQSQVRFYKVQRARQAAAAGSTAPADPKAPETMGTVPAEPDSHVQMEVPAQPMEDSGATPLATSQTASQTMPQTTSQTRRKKAAVFSETAVTDPNAEMMSADKPLRAAEVAVGPTNPAPQGQPDRAAARAMAQKLEALDPANRMQAIMALSPAELARLRGSLGPVEGPKLMAGLTPEQKERITALEGGVRMIALEAMESRVLRDVLSNRQLEAVMTDFWLNHFNVYVRKNQNEPYLLPAYERETIRPHALGKFEDLLVATAQSPAMEVYLDNFRSVGPDSPQAQRIKAQLARNPDARVAKQASEGLNENYGRELMELHTLGVNGGYTQADVTQVAKVFTGWGIDRPYQGGQFEFQERRHEPGDKVVLGQTIHEGGEKEGLQVLHMLATSPATAHFISTKLAIRFVSDTPPPALVDRMAASFLKSDGDIKTVLRTMFDSPEFWSVDAYRAKVKTPEEFVLSAVRASGAQIVNPQALVAAIDKLGQPLYGMQTPNGYSWLQDGWVSTGALVNRMNFALILSANRLPGVRTDWSRLLSTSSAGVISAGVVSAGLVQADVVQTKYDPAAAEPSATRERRLEQVLLGDPVSERTRATVIAQSNDQTATQQALTQFDLGGGPNRAKGSYQPPRSMRAASSPDAAPQDAQAQVMAGLLLGSPEFQRR